MEFFTIFEYGVHVESPSHVSLIKFDILSYAGLGAAIGFEEIRHYCEISEEVVRLYLQKEKSVRREVESKFRHAINSAKDHLIKATLAGGPMHTVFQDNYLFIEKIWSVADNKYSLFIQEIHPDLCDDSVDRVIDGIHCGKKWKHAVRTAQQHLKALGLIHLIDRRWVIV